MLEGPGAESTDPYGDEWSPGPLHPRPWEVGRETVLRRASSRGLKVAQRAGTRRRLVVARVDVGAQVVAADAGGGFELQNPLRSCRLACIEALPNSALCNLNDASSRSLPAGNLDRFREGIRRGERVSHTHKV